MQFPSSVLAGARTITAAEVKANQDPEVNKRISEAISALPTSIDTGDDGSTRLERSGKTRDHLIGIAAKHDGKIGDATISDILRSQERIEREIQADNEAGFRRNVTIGAKMAYNDAMAGKVGGANLKSVEEALAFVSTQMSLIRNNVTTINNHGAGDTEVGGAFTSTYEPIWDATSEFNEIMKWNEAKTRDRLEGSRLSLPYNTQRFEKSFEIEGPIFDRVNGELQIGQFDIVFEGNKIARSLGGGATAEYRPDGTLKLDKSL